MQKAEKVFESRLLVFDSLEFLSHRFALALYPYTHTSVISLAIGQKKETKRYRHFSKALQNQELKGTREFSDLIEKVVSVPLTKVIVSLSNSVKEVQKMDSSSLNDIILQFDFTRNFVANKFKSVAEDFLLFLICLVSHSISSWMRAPSAAAAPNLSSVEWLGASSRKRDILSKASKALGHWCIGFHEVLNEMLALLIKIEEICSLVFVTESEYSLQPLHHRIHQVYKGLRKDYYKVFLPYYQKTLAISHRFHDYSRTLEIFFAPSSHCVKEVFLAANSQPHNLDSNSGSCPISPTFTEGANEFWGTSLNNRNPILHGRERSLETLRGNGASSGSLFLQQSTSFKFPVHDLNVASPPNNRVLSSMALKSFSSLNTSMRSRSTDAIPQSPSPFNLPYSFANQEHQKVKAEGKGRESREDKLISNIQEDIKELDNAAVLVLNKMLINLESC